MRERKFEAYPLSGWHVPLADMLVKVLDERVG